MKKLLIVLFLLTGWASAQTSFSYSISSDMNTSAGVFDSTGALIRTLWSTKPELAGSHGGSWDGLTDSGATPTTGNGTYTFKVLSDNVNYQWDGLIGGTENAWFDTHNQWDLLGYNTNQMRPTFIGSTAVVAGGYSEGSYGLYTFDTARPNTPQIINTAYKNQQVQFADAANDGTFIYLANSQVYSGENFVTKFYASSLTPAAFTNGSIITGNYGYTGFPMSGINVYSDANNIPVAIAVQNSGNILAVSYKGYSTTTAPVINFYDKTSGAAIGTPVTLGMGIPATSMGFTSAGLWYVSNGGLYLLASPSTSSTATQPITGLSNVQYVATNKTLNNVVVLDGGTHQQVFEYNSSNTLTRTYGVAGGFTSNGFDPTVTNDKLNVDGKADYGTTAANGSWVKVDNSEGLWICDNGTDGRILHINSANTYVEQIVYRPDQYSLAVSLSMPTRLFKLSYEYAIDYSKPLLPGDPNAAGGNGAWKLVKNWAVGAEGANGSPVAVNTLEIYTHGIKYAEKLSNGRTYAIFDNTSTRYEVELPSSGPARYTTGTPQTGAWIELEPDGSYEEEVASGTAPNLTLTISKAALTGFDASGNPIRSAFTTLGTVAYNSTTQAALSDSGWGTKQSYVATTSGVIPMFLTDGKSVLGFPHLGGMLIGRTTPLFEAYPEAPIQRASYHGVFPGGAGYGGHAGQKAQALGNYIYTAYDGQYSPWGNNYCQWMQDGLLVGCYGLPTQTVGFNRQDSSGNIATEGWVTVSSDVYMYHTSESGLTPIHRWHISNLGSIYEATGTGVVGSSVNLQ